MPITGDGKFVAFLAENGYHPRSSKHGDALCGFLLHDLLEVCEPFRSAAVRGDIVFQRNFTIDPDSADGWNADLVVGPPDGPIDGPASRIGSIAQGDPRDIWLAVDAKTIMTEHGKARRNRQRDLNSFQDILHRKSLRTIVGGLLVLNIADHFQTPLARTIAGVTIHKNIVRMVDEIVRMMGALARSGPTPERGGLEALGIIVVEHSNVTGEQTRHVTEHPAPAPGAPLGYQTFLEDLCLAFATRFAT